MSKDSAYKFSLQFEVRLVSHSPVRVNRSNVTGNKCHGCYLSVLCWFIQELKSVGLDLTHDAADLPVNRPKNRYTNILPCESAELRPSCV